MLAQTVGGNPGLHQNPISHWKALARGRTDHLSTLLADRGYSAGCYLFTVSNSGLLFSTVP